MMSVMELKIEDFANIATTLTINDRFTGIFREMLDSKVGITEKDINDRISCFVERCYIANRLAFQIQYNESNKIEIKRLEKEDLNGRVLTEKELFRVLDSLSYNVFTNAGRSFLSKGDLEKINRIIETIAYEFFYSVIG